MSSASSTRDRPPSRVRETTQHSVVAHPWIWSFLAVLAVWLSIGIYSGRGFAGTMESAIELAPFLVLVGIGQMFVITAGNGNIDLSVGYLMTLTAFVSTSVLNTGHGSILLGIGAGLLCGLVVAGANLVCILLLSIPPIVATLSTGLIAESAALHYSSTQTAFQDPRLDAFTSQQIAGISLLALLCIVLAIVAALVLRYTRYGRGLQAIGQNMQAADLSGVNVQLVLIITYCLSGMLAGLSGVLLGAYTSPSLGLGDPYVLDSVAVVVIGGSLISGGRSFSSGVWGGALFLILLLTLLNVMHIAVAVQNIVKGVLIICVLALAGAGTSQSS